MKNLDVDIYINQFKGFFEKNPNDLMSLIGEVQADEFFNKVEEQCYKNLENGSDITVTKQQLIDIVLELKTNEPNGKDFNSNVKRVFQQTKYGEICLN